MIEFAEKTEGWVDVFFAEKNVGHIRESVDKTCWIVSINDRVATAETRDDAIASAAQVLAKSKTITAARTKARQISDAVERMQAAPKFFSEKEKAALSGVDGQFAGDPLQNAPKSKFLIRGTHRTKKSAKSRNRASGP
jgi:hypothetical protein